MASRKDVVMAQFETGVAEEERKMQKRIEDSTTIRSLDNITAMAEGASMGQELGTAATEMYTGIKGMRQKFKMRKEAKAGFIRKEGMTKKEWRKDPQGKKGYKEMAKAFEEDDLDKGTLVSMYLEGVNVTKQSMNAKGELETTDDKESDKVTNLNQYPAFGTGSDIRRGVTVGKGIANVLGFIKGKFN